MYFVLNKYIGYISSTLQSKQCSFSQNKVTGKLIFYSVF